MPARKRSGPTCSSISSGSSTAIATRRFGSKQAPWSLGKVARRSLKYAIFLAISIATGGAWIFYFADAPTLAQRFIAGEASYVAYATVGVLTATTFILGGFMREQVCIYMCPWPRIQTAMLDEKSLIVTYKDWRGEPRGKGRRTASLADLGLGDCIDCNACVAVCPTGTDIRNGQQIGCITCALCIDACDQVMAKIGKPRGLIDYATLEDCKVEAAGGQAKPLLKTILRPRTLIYFALWAAVGLIMLVRGCGQGATDDQRPTPAQSVICPAVRRPCPQRFHGQDPQHGSPAPRDGCVGHRSSRRGPLDAGRLPRDRR